MQTIECVHEQSLWLHFLIFEAERTGHYSALYAIDEK